MSWPACITQLAPGKTSQGLTSAAGPMVTVSPSAVTGLNRVNTSARLADSARWRWRSRALIFFGWNDIKRRVLITVGIEAHGSEAGAVLGT
jgi:hypothetical protein